MSASGTHSTSFEQKKDCGIKGIIRHDMFSIA
jgi:hypothetical protein